MKITVKIADRTFDVEVGDVRERPVVATIDGERFEVWPESSAGAATGGAVEATAVPVGSAAPVSPAAPARRPRPSSIGAGVKAICAPIPGVILSVAVAAGSTVTRGQTVCVLEAMKMKNPIRAPRAGQIATVHVSAGQAVRHDEVLMELAD